MLIHPSSGACDLFVELFRFILLFNAQHVSDVKTSILGACDLFVELFHGLYCSGTMRVGVGVVWLGWCVITIS